jgi:ATP-dependent RNA helicase RhlE
MNDPLENRTPGFADFALGPKLLRGIAAAGFVEPRPIQTRTIPEALEGRDVLGLAQTGTGKTAAFALPLLERLLQRRAAGPRVLIVAPTRELASQIDAEIRSLARYTSIGSVTVFGGVSVKKQVDALRRQPEIVVGCPGRILDLHGQRALRLDRIETLVLDEADHMFDMGFLPDIRRILAALPKERQNLLFSATMPGEIRGLAKQVLRRPHVVDVNHSRPIATIEHALYPVESGKKLELLRHVMGEDGFASAIVFTRTKHRARNIARRLADAGHAAVALQGNMSQNARERAMQGFRDRRFNVLVATDIAARGIDVEQVSHVINFDMPGTVDAYTHRIGRTGRSEREGKGYTFVTHEDLALIRAVEGRLGEPIPRRSVQGIAEVRLPEGRQPAAGPARARNSAGPGAGRNRTRSRRRRPSREARRSSAA